MATIRDVAREAGVSLMTASRVVRGEEGVSDKTRARVLQEMEKLGYQPDQLAKALRTRQNNTVGIIVSDVENVFYMQVIAQMEQRLKAKGFSVLISFSNEDADVEISSAAMMLGVRVSGLMITPVRRQDNKLEQLLVGRGVAVLQLYRNVYPQVDSLVMDDRYGARVATRRLLEEGHRRILLLDVDWEGRAAGYRAAFQEMGVPLDERYIQTFRLNVSEEERIREHLQHLWPSAIVAGTNLLGHAAVSACRKLGLDIPRDISLIIQDDISWVSLMDITAISQPMGKIAQEAVEILLESIQRARSRKGMASDTSQRHRVIRPSLIERASIAPPGPDSGR